jgi:hypothetical protein
VLREAIGELLERVDFVHAGLLDGVRGHGVIYLFLGRLFWTQQAIRAGHRGLRRRLTLYCGGRELFCRKNGGIDSHQGAFPRPFAGLRGPHRTLDRRLAALLSAQRVRRTPRCVLQAAADVLSGAAGALVTTADACVVVADAQVCLQRVRHVAARVFRIAQSARRAAAGALVSTERVLWVAARTLVSLEDVPVARIRTLVSRQRLRRVTADALVGPADMGGR